ncbi:MAG: replicative DNA helicase [Firmicutes bacterium]|nr:replicative DNA helicase [Bacillota bacterium]
MAERIPPQSKDAERSVLGAVMLNKDMLFEVVTKLTADDFYYPENREIFAAILDLYNDNKAVDVLTVSDRLKQRGTLKMAGGRANVAQLTLDVPSTVNAMEYARIVSDKAALRRMINVTEDITDKSYQDSVDAQDIMEYAESSIFAIAQKNQKKDYEGISNVLITNIHDIEEAVKNGGKITGVPTGFKELDEVVNGFQNSNLVVIAARPAMGKTAFSLNIAEQTAVKNGSTVMIFSLEMSKEQLGQRLLSSEARVDLKKLQRGKLESDDWKRINIALDELNKAKIFIDDTPEVSFAEIRNKCRRLKAEHGLDMVLVDYMQLMKSPEKADNRQAEISAISRNLKLLAREMDCPVVAISQLSRGPEQRQDHYPNLADLRESGAIEQDADLVIFLYRDEYYNPDTTQKPGICEVDVAKNRHGETKKVELTWIDRYAKFSDKAM